MGDEVLSVSTSGAVGFSPVIALPHAANRVAATFVELVTEDGRSLRLTPTHLIARLPGCQNLRGGLADSLTEASDVRVGDCLVTAEANSTMMEMSRVVRINQVRGEGIYSAVARNAFLVSRRMVWRLLDG